MTCISLIPKLSLKFLGCLQSSARFNLVELSRLRACQLWQSQNRGRAIPRGVRVIYQNGIQFQAESRDHHTLSDQPLVNQGQDIRHQRVLEKAVDACIIHNTLTHPPKMTAEIQILTSVGA